VEGQYNIIVNSTTGLFAYALIVLGITARLVPHPPNVTPLVAVALFSGAVFPRRIGVIVPLAAVIFSDIIIGADLQVAFNWCAFALVAGIGWKIAGQRAPKRLAAAAISGSTLFFIMSNLGVWCVGLLYPRTWQGLINCYIAALPFYRNMVIGDLAYTAVLFGAFGLMCRWMESPQPCL